jgi:hypothetical protein
MSDEMVVEFSSSAICMDLASLTSDLLAISVVVTKYIPQIR